MATCSLLEQVRKKTGSTMRVLMLGWEFPPYISGGLGTACYVKGANKISKALQKKLKVEPGETTPDKKFTLEAVRCVGACGLAPIMLVNDEVHQNLNVDDSVDVINNCE